MPVCETYRVARSVFGTYPYANLVWLHVRVALWGLLYENTRLCIPGWFWLTSGLSCVPGDAHYGSLGFSPFLSTYLKKSKNKKFANYKQRALPSSTDIPVALARSSYYYRCLPLHIYLASTAGHGFELHFKRFFCRNACACAPKKHTPWFPR